MRGIIIVARQRTGTNWLRSVLGHSTTGQNLGEVFHPELTNDGNFFVWYKENHGQIPFNREFGWCVQLFSDYFNYIEEKCPVPVIDLKYHSFNAFGPSWISPTRLPLIMKLAMDRNYKVIHMMRKNLLENAVSEIIAARSGVYVSNTEVGTADKITIERDRFRHIIFEYLAELKFVAPLLQSYAGKMDLYYEEMEAALRNERMEGLIQDVIFGSDIEYKEYRPAGVVKLVKDWRNIVANADLVESWASEIGVT
jgi:hypothetical protein